MENHSTTSCSNAAVRPPQFRRGSDGAIIVGIQSGNDPQATLRCLRECHDRLMSVIDDYVWIVSR